MKPAKPAKPYPDFPLFYHQTGQWAKKVRGRTHYFGTDPDAALSKYLEQRDDLQAGRASRAHAEGLTLRDLANRFLTAKKVLLDSGELSPRTWGHYYLTCERLIEAFGRTRPVAGLGAEDFERLRAELAKTRGAHALAGEVQRVRTLFKFAWDEGLVEKPVRFGTTFKKPSKKAFRRAKHAAGPRLIEAADVRRLVAAAGTPLRAMILLGVNCGFGQTDVANLPLSSLDLAGGWIDFPRPKTEVVWRCPLWPETVAALRQAIAARPTPKAPADAGLVFVTTHGRRWVLKAAWNTNPIPPDRMTVAEAAEVLKVPEGQVRKDIQRGRLDAIEGRQFVGPFRRSDGAYRQRFIQKATLVSRESVERLKRELPGGGGEQGPVQADQLPATGPPARKKRGRPKGTLDRRAASRNESMRLDWAAGRIETITALASHHKVSRSRASKILAGKE
jgi:hypothetical protein